MKPSQLQAFLKVAIKEKMPVLVKGAPGIGKSDIVTQVTEELKCDLIIEHPVVSDPTDFKGLPFPKGEEADFLPFGSLKQIIETNKPTVFFLDDLGQAPPAVQAACMQLILARKINGHKVSDQVTFIAATNRRIDQAGVQGLLEPVKSRFVSIIELTPDLEDWCKWALENNMPPELVAFIRFRPNLLFDFTPTKDLVNSSCPRTVANVGKLINMGIPKELEYELFTGAAGERFASEFMGFLKIYRNLPNPDTVLMDPQNAPVPDEPATLYALCGALAHRVNENSMPRFVEYLYRIPPEYSVMAMKDAVTQHPEITNQRAFIEWANKHNDVLF